MKQEYNKHLQKSLELSKELILLANQGEIDSLDNGCRVLYGIVRDCGYKIKTQAEHEMKKHHLRTVENKFTYPDGHR